MTGQAMIAGMRGEDEAAGQLAQQAEAVVLPMRISAVLCGIQFARGVTAISAGRYDEAFDHLSRVFDRADPSCQAVQSTWVLGDLAEASLRTGRTARARQITEAFRPGKHDNVALWTRVALLCAAPLLAGDEAAEGEFRTALEADLVRWPCYRARPPGAAPPGNPASHCAPNSGRRCPRRSCRSPSSPPRAYRTEDIGQRLSVAPDRRLTPVPDLPEAGHQLQVPAPFRPHARRRIAGSRTVALI